MSCTNCTDPHPCQSGNCTCPVKDLSTDCVLYTGDNLTCSGIQSRTILTDVIEQFDAFVCQLVQTSLNRTLVNVGTGAQVYKGDDNLGNKQIRSILTTPSITVTQNTNDITPSVNTEWLEDQIETYIETNPPCIESDTLIVTVEDGCTRIENPQTSFIDSIYINNLYIPVYPDTTGKGTLAAPFTDTRVYNLDGTVASITPNTAIQNGLDYYVGSGTALNPQRSGQQIVVQNNNNTYTFPGNFNYSNINIRIEANVTTSATTFLIDMDNTSAFSAMNSQAMIEIADNFKLDLSSTLGVNNTGNINSGATFNTGRILYLNGNGTIYSSKNDITKYIINADPDSTSNGGAGSNNDGNIAIYIRCMVKADLQGIYKVGGKSKIDVLNILESGTQTNTVNTLLKAYHQTGGQVRCLEKGSISFGGNTRIDAISFSPASPFIPVFIAQNTTFKGTATNLFTKTNTSDTDLQVTSSNSGYSVTLTNIFESSNLWSLTFTNNIFQSGEIDVTKADLTRGNIQSATNTIGGNVIEILKKQPSRTSAEGVYPVGTKFINTASNSIDPDDWFIDITMQ